MKKAWESDVEGSDMYKLAMRIKICRIELLRWSMNYQTNSAKRIEQLKKELDELKEMGSDREWKVWTEKKVVG